MSAWYVHLQDRSGKEISIAISVSEKDRKRYQLLFPPPGSISEKDINCFLLIRGQFVLYRRGGLTRHARLWRSRTRQE